MPGTGGPSTSSLSSRTAIEWATRIPDCAGRRTVDVNRLGATAPDLNGHTASLRSVVSAATCTIEAHPILVLVFADLSSERSAQSALSRIVPALAVGPGWIVAAARPDSDTQALSLVQGVALTLNATVLRGTGTTGSAPNTP